VPSHSPAGGVVERSDRLTHAITRTRTADHLGNATQAMLRERTHTPIATQASGGVRSHGVSRGTCVSVPITPMRDPALGTRRSVNSVT